VSAKRVVSCFGNVVTRSRVHEPVRGSANPRVERRQVHTKKLRIESFIRSCEEGLKGRSTGKELRRRSWHTKEEEPSGGQRVVWTFRELRKRSERRRLDRRQLRPCVHPRGLRRCPAALPHGSTRNPTPQQDAAREQHIAGFVHEGCPLSPLEPLPRVL